MLDSTVALEPVCSDSSLHPKLVLDSAVALEPVCSDSFPYILRALLGIGVFEDGI